MYITGANPMEQMYVSGHTMEMLISSGFSKNAKIDHRKKIFIQKTNIWCKMAGWTNVHPAICLLYTSSGQSVVYTPIDIRL